MTEITGDRIAKTIVSVIFITLGALIMSCFTDIEKDRKAAVKDMMEHTHRVTIIHPNGDSTVVYSMQGPLVHNSGTVIHTESGEKIIVRNGIVRSRKIQRPHRL